MQHQFFLAAVEVPAFEKAMWKLLETGNWTGKRPDVVDIVESTIGNTYLIECNIQDFACLMIQTGIEYRIMIEACETGQVDTGHD
jgi:hypothetical protein